MANEKDFVEFPYIEDIPKVHRQAVTEFIKQQDVQQQKNLDIRYSTIRKSLEAMGETAKLYMTELGSVGMAGPRPLMEVVDYKDYEKVSEDQAKAVKVVRDEREAIYNKYPSVFSQADKIVDSAVESVTNPINIAVGGVTASFTGGLSIPLQIMAQVGAGHAQLQYETRMIEGRAPTVEEGITDAVMSSVPEFIGWGLNKGFSKSLDYSLSAKGDLDVDIRGKFDAQEDSGLLNGYNKSSMFEEYVDSRNTYEHDPSITTFKSPIKEYNELTMQGETPLIRAYKNELSKIKDIDTSYDVTNPKLKNKVADDFTKIKMAWDETGQIEGFQAPNRYNYAEDLATNLEQYIDLSSKEFNKARKKGLKGEIKLNKNDISRPILRLKNEFERQNTTISNTFNHLRGGKSEIDYIKTLNTNTKQLTKDDVRLYSAVTQPYEHQQFLQAQSKQRRITDTFNVRNKHFESSETLEVMARHNNLFDNNELVVDSNLFDTITKEGFSYEDHKAIVNTVEFDEIFNHFKGLDKMSKGEKAFMDLHKRKFFNYMENINDIKTPIDVDMYEHSKFKAYTEDGLLTDNAQTTIRLNRALHKDNFFRKYTEPNYYNVKDEVSPFDLPITELYEKYLPGYNKDIESIKLRYDGAINEARRNGAIIDYENQIIDNIMTPEKLDELDLAISPFYDKHFSLDEDIPDFYYSSPEAKKKYRALHFYKFMNAMHDTRAKVGTANKKSLGDLSLSFKDRDSFVNFFLDEHEEFILSDRDYMMKVLPKGREDSARLLTYGTTNPRAIQNMTRRRFEANYKKLKGKRNLNDGEIESIKEALKTFDTMIENTQGIIEGNKTIGVDHFLKAGRMAMRPTLWGGGLEEMGLSNYSLSYLKASRYDSSLFSKEIMFNSLKMVKKAGVKSDLDSGLYSIAGNFNDMDYRRLADFSNVKNGYDTVDTFALTFQRMSDRQQKNFAQGFTTNILHKMKPDYNKLNNDLKLVLKQNGINDTNYLEFRKYTIDHIDNNGLITNLKQLDSIIELDEYNGTTSGYARQLRQSYQDIWNDLTIDSQSSLKKNMGSELEKTYNMFRRFSRALSSDTMQRVLTYIDADGYTRYRGTGGTADIDGTKFANLAKKGVTIPLVMTVGGMGYTLQKEIIRGARNGIERQTVVQDDIDNILDNLYDAYSQRSTIGKFVALIGYLGVNEYTPINPQNLWGELKATDIYTSKINKVMKIYKTLADPLKSPQVKELEAKKQISDLTLSFFPNLRNTAYLFMNSDEERIKKVFGRTSEDVLEMRTQLRTNQRFIKNIMMADTKEDGEIDLQTVPEEFKITKPLTKRKFIKDTKKQYQDQIKQTKAILDYAEDNTDTYNELSLRKKDIFEKAFTYANIKEEDKTKYKAEFALLSRTANKGKVPDILKEVFDIQNYSDFDRYYTSLYNYDKLSKGKKDLFKTMVDNGYIKNDTEEKRKYYQLFKTLPVSHIESTLKTQYNIDNEGIVNLRKGKIEYGRGKK